MLNGRFWPKADTQYKSIMVDMVRDQLQFHNYRIMVLKDAKEMCDQVSRAVAMKCEVGKIDLSDIIKKDGINQ